MLSHLTNAPVEPKQQGSLSSLFMSVFSRSGDFPAVPQVQPPPHIGAESVTFYNVLESGVGSHQVKLTLSEGGLITERGKDKVVTRYGLTKIEWYAVDDTASEFLIQYHDLQADDKFQVAFRSHEYRTIYEHFCHYLSLKGDKLRNKQKEREQSGLVDALPVVEMAEGDVDTLAPHMPSPGSPLVLPAAPLHHHHYPSSGDHHHHPLHHHHQQQHLHPHTGLHGSPSVGRSSPRVGSSSTTKKTSISSPRISFVAEPPVDKNKADASPAEGLLVVLPPPPRNRASTPVLKRAGATGPIGASPLGSASHSFEVLAVPSPGSPLVQPQQRPSTTHHDPAPSAPPFDLIDWH